MRRVVDPDVTGIHAKLPRLLGNAVALFSLVRDPFEFLLDDSMIKVLPSSSTHSKRFP
jgi:hypothetical protein